MMFKNESSFFFGSFFVVTFGKQQNWNESEVCCYSQINLCLSSSPPLPVAIGLETNHGGIIPVVICLETNHCGILIGKNHTQHGGLHN